MTRFRPRISRFIQTTHGLSIDWEHMRSAFDITRQHGDAGLFHQPDGPGTYGIGASIAAETILGFELRPVPETELTEVILRVTYPPGEKCLGITNQLSEAAQWVAEANGIIQRVRQNSR